MTEEIVLQKVRALCIPEPLNATVATVKLALSGFVAKKAIDEGTFLSYMGVLNPPIQVLMDGLKAFSLDQTGISHRAQNAIAAGIQAMQARLARSDIKPDEAREIRHMILELVREARIEASEHRILTLGFAAFATTAFIAAMGGALTLLDRKQGNRPLALK